MNAADAVKAKEEEEDSEKQQKKKKPNRDCQHQLHQLSATHQLLNIRCSDG